MGGMFDWLTGKTTDVETPENILAETESSVAPSLMRVETSESAKVIREAKQKKREKDDSEKRTFTLAGSDTALLAEQAKVLDALLDPKVWRGAVAAPGDMMVAVTGKKHWELSDDERDTLAKTGAATARCFAFTDPKWLALSLFSFSILSIYGGRMVKDLKDNADAKRGAVSAVKAASVS
jgi:hypothetical protein